MTSTASQREVFAGMVEGGYVTSETERSQLPGMKEEGRGLGVGAAVEGQGETTVSKTGVIVGTRVGWTSGGNYSERAWRNLENKVTTRVKSRQDSSQSAGRCGGQPWGVIAMTGASRLQKRVAGD